MSVSTSSRHRSLGLKLMLVGGLAFSLWLPALLVYGLVFERSNRAKDVWHDIVSLAGGPQTISGPVILAPATVETGRRKSDGEPVLKTLFLVFTPQRLTIDATATASQRQRSIYQATVYDADIRLHGRFGPLVPPQLSGSIREIAWDRAVLALKFANDTSLKGVRAAPDLMIDGAPYRGPFEPGVSLSVAGRNNTEASLAEAGVSVAFPVADPAKGFDFDLALAMSGGGGLYVSPSGEETAVTLRSNWPDPSFQGAYLPDARTISADGFSAEWRVHYLARNLPRAFTADGGLGLLEHGKTFGVEFIDAASPYQSVNRALKYALMFLGVVFLTLFLFEAATGVRAHPAQYILLGMAQVIFYLLVLAFSEHLGFDLAFAATAAATVALSGAYAATVFRSRRRGIVAFVAFSGAYGLIYLLMKSEDYALLIGSVTAFSAIAFTMFVTRNLDWYGGRDKA